MEYLEHVPSDLYNFSYDKEMADAVASDRFVLRQLYWNRKSPESWVRVFASKESSSPGCIWDFLVLMPGFETVVVPDMAFFGPVFHLRVLG